jgi:GGDEF domain-containing protein
VERVALDSLLVNHDRQELGSVQASPILKVLRPATFALWAALAAIQLVAVLNGKGDQNWLTLLASTALFVAVHLQFWFEESDNGQQATQALDKMRGTIYEDELTGLPNSRHFVFELRRQMMRSVRNGRGFSLVLTDLQGLDKNDYRKALPAVGKGLRLAASDGDFVAHLEGPVFAAIVVDDRERTVGEKADALYRALESMVPGDRRGRVVPVAALTGYQGELEVRDFLRRAQRDLVGARSRSAPILPEPRGHAAFGTA